MVAGKHCGRLSEAQSGASGEVLPRCGSCIIGALSWLELRATSTGAHSATEKPSLRAYAGDHDAFSVLTGEIRRLESVPGGKAWSLVVENKRALLISADTTESAVWAALLAAEDWSVEVVQRRSQALERIPEFLPSLLVLDLRVGEVPGNIEESFAQRCRDSGLAAIVILHDPSPHDVAVSFRRGAIDVLIPPFGPRELMAAVNRAGSFKDLYQENMDYRRQLERANRELRESFNVLRMDQLAGRQVQLDILPRQPLKCRGYQVAHSMVPSLYLSGDFVGYNAVFDRYILFYFGDVSGHGASSAFVTVMLAFLLRQLRRRHVAEEDFAALARAPEGLAEHLNRQMLAMDLDKHLTFFSGA